MLGHSTFENKIAIVSGAAQGIGKSVADALLHAGAQVVELDIRFPSTDLVLNNDRKSYQLRLDVTDFGAVTKAVHAIETTIGPMDYFANVAGILRMGALIDATDNDWSDTFNVNTTGAFNMCRAVARVMIPRQRGAIVAVSSNSSNVPRMNMGSYCASKAATTQLIKCFGLELAQYNIRCNIVSPGSTDTDMQRQLWEGPCDAEKVIRGSLDTHRLGIPLQKIASTESIAHSVMFLLSDDASHITMANTIIDGGATLGC